MASAATAARPGCPSRSARRGDKLQPEPDAGGQQRDQFREDQHGMGGQRVDDRRQPPGHADADEGDQVGAGAQERGLPPAGGGQPVQRTRAPAAFPRAAGQAQQPPRRAQHNQRGRDHGEHHELRGLGDDVPACEPFDGQAGHDQGGPGGGEPGPDACHQRLGSLLCHVPLQCHRRPGPAEGVVPAMIADRRRARGAAAASR